MRTSLHLLFLGSILVTGPWRLAEADEAFLRAGTSARREAGDRLLSEAAHLAKALRWTFGDKPSALALARQRLAQEADALEDQHGASLLRGYAARAPPNFLLAWPLLPGFWGLAPESAPDTEEPLQDVDVAFGRDDSTPMFGSSSSESQETVVRTDDQGRSVTRSRRCKNGHCVEQTKVGKGPMWRFWRRSREAAQGAAGSSPLFGQGLLAEAVRSMARTMRSVEESLGRDGLEDVLDQLFSQHGAAADGGKATEFGAQEGHQQPAKAGVGGFLKRAAAAAARNVQSVSSSTEVVIENGKVMRRTKECRNGVCETKVEQGGSGGPAASGQPGEGEQAAGSGGSDATQL